MLYTLENLSSEDPVCSPGRHPKYNPPTGLRPEYRLGDLSSTVLLEACLLSNVHLQTLCPSSNIIIPILSSTKGFCSLFYKTHRIYKVDPYMIMSRAALRVEVCTLKKLMNTTVSSPNQYTAMFVSPKGSSSLFRFD
ncbi:hypothetical protein FXO37_30631 [Capsicum annuum]|nr:hypothetical protein FXO37_30631 [Capsicum annuum]